MNNRLPSEIKEDYSLLSNIFRNTISHNETSNSKDITVDDFLEIQDINEVDIMNNLHNRFHKPKTFTNLGPILLMLKPSNEENTDEIYNDTMVDTYIINQGKTKEPHLYKTIMNALIQLSLPNPQNQAVIINGESRSGKTETYLNAIKFINMYYNKPHCTSNENSIEAKIVHSQFILSAFGNAMTIYNNDSSRFGKQIKIKVDKNTNKIIGSHITTYQLDKSRITDLYFQERNYHIFYYLLKGGKDTILSSLHLSSNIQDYQLLYKSTKQVTTIPNVDDKRMYLNLIKSVNSIGFHEEDMNIIRKVIAAVLLLGNIEPLIENEVCIFKPVETYANICNLLGCNESLLNITLSKKPPNFGSKEYGGFYNENEIRNNKNALARELYNKLFLWIVTKMNSLTQTDIEPSMIKQISIIDFYGYECYKEEQKTNSISQLYMNYTQEELLKLCLKTIEKNHLKQYEEEGIIESISKMTETDKDNKDIVRLMKILFDKTCDNMTENQLFSIISSFKTELEKKPSINPLYSKINQLQITTDTKDQQSFIINHSFQSIQYTLDNYYTNNLDQLKPNVIDCFLSSTNQLIQQIFTNTLTEQSNTYIKTQIIRERLKPDANSFLLKYICSKTVLQLKSLKAELKDYNLHFIICLKPNNNPNQSSFDPSYVYNQICYNNLIRIAKMMTGQFIISYQYNQFYDEFCYVLDMTRTYSMKTNEEYKHFDKLIMQRVMSSQYDMNGGCIYGKNMLFLKEDTALEFKEKARAIPRSTTQSKAAEVLIVALYYYRKQRKLRMIKDNVAYIQKSVIDYMNRPGREVIAKKNAIDLIQSAIQASFANKEFDFMMKYNDNLVTINNSCMIYLSRKYIEKLRQYHTLIAIRMKIFLEKRTKGLRKKMTEITRKICRDAFYHIFYSSYNDIWQKTRSFIIMHQVQKDNKQIIKTVKRTINYWKIEDALNLFQECNFLNKIYQRSLASKHIVSFVSTQMVSDYYRQLRNKIILIQAYVSTEKMRLQILKNLTHDHLSNSNNKLKLRMQSMSKILFPNYQLASYYFTKTGYELPVQHKSSYKTSKSQSFHTFVTHNNSHVNQTFQNSTTAMRGNNSKLLGKIINTASSPLLLTRCDSIMNNNKQQNGKPSMTSFDQQSSQRQINNEDSNSLQGIFPKIEAKIEPNIFLFAKILDFDLIGDDSEIYQDSWAKYFTKVYEYNLNKSTPIQIIQLSNTHTLALNNKGRLFTWGLNNYSQCGLSQSVSFSVSVTALNQSLPKLTSSSSMPKLSRYEKITKLNHEKEQPFLLPVPLYYNDQTIIYKSPSTSCSKIIAGEDYTTILTTNGDLYSFGNNSKGQFGKGNKKQYHNTSLWINNNIDGNRYIIKDIHSAGKFNAFITSKNEFFLWNVSHRNISVNPTRLYLDKKITIKHVSCGKNFMIILSEQGLLYGTGSNTHGELCNEEKRARACPEELHSINKLEMNIIQVRCGYKHVVALSSDGYAYTWGNNTFGQLGNFDTQKTSLSDIKLPIDGKIIQIAAGFRSTIVMTEYREIVFCGKLSEENQSFSPTVFSIKLKSIEYYDRNKFSPVRIMSTWNQSFSLFYVTMADTRLISQHLILGKVNDILNDLANHWHMESSKSTHIILINSQCSLYSGIVLY